jgi:hypothetical protein
VLAAALGPEAGVLEALERRVEIGGNDGEVAHLGHDRFLARHQVNLGALAFEPGEFAQRLRWLHPLEPEQLEETCCGLDIRGRDLDSNVMKHA